MSEATSVKRTLIGRVVSNKMQKTVNVLIENKVQHPKYGKYIKRRTKKLAHTEEPIGIGALVEIEECRPLSRHKNFKVINVIEKSAE